MNDYLHRKNGFAEVSKSLFVDAENKSENKFIRSRKLRDPSCWNVKTSSRFVLMSLIV